MGKFVYKNEESMKKIHDFYDKLLDSLIKTKIVITDPKTSKGIREVPINKTTEKILLE